MVYNCKNPTGPFPIISVRLCKNQRRKGHTSRKHRTAGEQDMRSEQPGRVGPAMANARPSGERISADKSESFALGAKVAA
jgi:hypothetical protein